MAPEAGDGSLAEVDRCLLVDRSHLERLDAARGGRDLDEHASCCSRKRVPLGRSPRIGVPRDEGAAFVTRSDSTAPVEGLGEIHRETGSRSPHERNTEPNCGDRDSSTAGGCLGCGDALATAGRGLDVAAVLDGGALLELAVNEQPDLAADAHDGGCGEGLARTKRLALVDLAVDGDLDPDPIG